MTAPVPPASAPQAGEPQRGFLDARCSHGGPCEGRDAYRMIGGCYNCHSEVLGLFTVGHEARGEILGPDCPVCWCPRLYWKRLATLDEIPAGFEGGTDG